MTASESYYIGFTILTVTQVCMLLHNQGCDSLSFGVALAIACPENCLNNRCHVDTGNCLEGCRQNFVGKKCDQTPHDNRRVPRQEGSVYNASKSLIHSECPTNCLNQVCHQTTGQCTYGCVPGFEGVFCHEGCKNGFYGINCSKVCANLCHKKECHVTTGRCFSCREGLHGDFCEKTYSSHMDKKTGLIITAAIISTVALIAFSIFLRTNKDEYRWSVLMPDRITLKRFSLFAKPSQQEEVSVKDVKIGTWV